MSYRKENEMELLSRLERYASEKPDVAAFKNAYTDDTITYKNLWAYSDKIAAEISATVASDKEPIVVYGHKNPLMLAAFLACVKTGHPYCPVDISMPQERLKDIVEASGTQLLIALEPTEVSAATKWDLGKLQGIIAGSDIAFAKDGYVSGSDVYYIIFTSGSTGKPKGVMITADCLDNYLFWMEQIVTRDGHKGDYTYLNQ